MKIYDGLAWPALIIVFGAWFLASVVCHAVPRLIRYCRTRSTGVAATGHADRCWADQLHHHDTE